MTYAAILADPPWSFKPYSEKGHGRSAERHYRTLDGDDLFAMRPPFGRDCVLFLWAVDPLLDLAFKVIEAWGFTYKTVAFTWVKSSIAGDSFPIGNGYWTRANPETCLLATRGKPKRINADVPQLMIAPRREHSRKPDETYRRIEHLVGGPYLEMFARQTWPGWHAMGNQVGVIA